jgi:hypothetical protein
MNCKNVIDEPGSGEKESKDSWKAMISGFVLETSVIRVCLSS